MSAALKIVAGAGLIAAGFIPGLQGLAFAGLKLTSALFAIGTSVSVGGISRYLQKPRSGSKLPNPAGRNQTIRQSAAVRTVIYGYVRTGGVLSFAHANGVRNAPTDQNQLIIAIAGHCITSIEALQFGDDYPDIDLTTGLGLGPYTNKLFYDMQQGADGDLGFSDVMVGDTPITAEHRFRGVAAAYVRINFDGQLFPNGVPNITFYVQGKPVFDPRSDSPLTVEGASNAAPIVITSTGHGFVGGEIIRILGCVGNTAANGTWGVDYIDADSFSLQGSTGNGVWTSGGQIFKLAYSNNAALVIADYLMDPWIGMGVPYARINESVLIAAANVCDEALEVDDASPPTTENRYTINGSFETSERPGEVLAQMANAMAGHVTYIGGEWHIIPGAFRLAVTELLDNDVVAPMAVQRFRSRSELFNGVKGTFPSSSHSYVETDFPPVTDAIYLAADQGVRAWKDIFLPFTVTAAAAQRLALIELERNRRQLAVDLVCGMRAYELQVGDVVEFTHPRYSWAQETFEVEECGLELISDADGAPALAVRLRLIQTDLDVYGFAVDEYGNVIDPDLLDFLKRKLPFGWSPGMVHRPDSSTVQMLPWSHYGFGVSQQYRVAADGTIVPQLRLGGMLPANTFSELIGRPRSKTLAATTAYSGGFIAGGQRYYIAVCGVDGLDGSPPSAIGGRLTSISDLAVIDIAEVSPAVNTNTVTLDNLRWPAATAGWLLFFGTEKYRLSYQTGYLGSLPAEVAVTGTEARPTSITFKGFNAPTQLPLGYYEHLRGAPDQRFDRLRIACTREIHGGIWGGQVVSVQAVDSPATQYSITLGVDPASPFTSSPATNEMAGRYVSLFGLRDTGLDLTTNGGMKLADFLIESNTADTITLAAGQDNPADWGYGLGAVVVIRTSVTSVGTDSVGEYVEDTGHGAGGQALGDADPNIGGGDGSLTGKVIRGISGTGIGETRVIAWNDVAAKKIYLEGDNPFAVGSIYVVLDPHPQLEYITNPLATDKFDSFTDIRFDCVNLPGEQYFIEAFSVSPDGYESPAGTNPYREIYVFGDADGGRLVAVDTKLTATDRFVRVDTTTGDKTITCLDPAAIRGLTVFIANVGAAGNTAIVQVDGGSLIGGQASRNVEDGETILIRAYED